MIVTIGVTLLLIVGCVVLHYETMRLLRGVGDWLHHRNSAHRWHLTLLVCIFLCVHVIEVILWAVAYLGMIQGADYGGIHGLSSPGLADCIYFSFSTYTTLGYGDLAPAGALRFMAGLEALSGLVLITWTASFMYLQMRTIWGVHPR